MALKLGGYHIPTIGNVSPITGQIQGQRHFTPPHSNPYANPARIGVGDVGASNLVLNQPTPGPQYIRGGIIHPAIKV
jgi:hypothetical protein